MFSSDKNIETIQKLFEEMYHYIKLQKEYLCLDATEKMATILSALALGAVLLLIGIIVIFSICITVALCIGKLIGSMPLAFAIVTGLLVLLLLLIYALRRRLIIIPITRFIAHVFLDKKQKGEKMP
jgi:phosphoglycerol transferase MdoB-like AlkP superfamily enzyme